MRVRVAFIAAVLGVLGYEVAAQPYVGSIVEDISTPLAFPPDQDGLTCTGLVWNFRVDAPVLPGNIKQPEMRVHLNNLVLPDNDAFHIEIADTSGNVVETLDRAVLAGRSDIWTLSISSIAAEVSVFGCDALTGLAFEIDQIAFPFEDLELESLYGTSDLIETNSYTGADSDLVTESASSVARLSVIKDRTETYCTAFRIGPDLVQTSSHCISDETDFCETTQIWFDYHKNEFGLPITGQKVRCLEIVDSAAPTQADTTILRVHPEPHAAYKIASFTPDSPQEGDPLFVPQHPGGLPQKLSIVDCVRQEDMRTQAHPNAYGHTCDTLRGSSGAPVFNLAGEVVGQHRAGHTNPEVTNCLNLATLPHLLDLSTGVTGQTTTASAEAC